MCRALKVSKGIETPSYIHLKLTLSSSEIQNMGCLRVSLVRQTRASEVSLEKRLMEWT
jgi:hypothetical protein